MALARALLHQPEVLFLDEPTSGLDPAATRDVLGLIGGLAEEQGATVVLCTHFLAEAARLCRRVAILEAGRLLAFGPPAGLAAGLWSGLPVDLDMGGSADAARVEQMRNVRGVTAVEPNAAGATVVVTDREVIPGVLAVAMPVFSAVPRPPGLEEVYFALTGRASADDAARAGVPT